MVTSFACLARAWGAAPPSHFHGLPTEIMISKVSYQDVAKLPQPLVDPFLFSFACGSRVSRPRRRTSPDDPNRPRAFLATCRIERRVAVALDASRFFLVRSLAMSRSCWPALNVRQTVAAFCSLEDVSRKLLHRFRHLPQASGHHRWPQPFFGACPVMLSDIRSEIPARSAICLNVCRHPWFGGSVGSARPMTADSSCQPLRGLAIRATSLRSRIVPTFPPGCRLCKIAGHRRHASLRTQGIPCSTKCSCRGTPRLLPFFTVPASGVIRSA